VTITNRLSSVPLGDLATPSARKLRVVAALPGGDESDRGARTVAHVLAHFQLEVTCTDLDQTPEEIVEAVIDEDAGALALPVHCAAHLALLPRIAELLQVGGIHDIFMTLGEPSPVREILGSPPRASAGIPSPSEIITSIETHLRPVAAHAICALRSARPPKAIWVFFALSPVGHQPGTDGRS
jgi:methylmalonyl-CoA mutase C-terminal domain/subunit